MDRVTNEMQMAELGHCMAEQIVNGPLALFPPVQMNYGHSREHCGDRGGDRLRSISDKQEHVRSILAQLRRNHPQNPSGLSRRI